MRGAQTATTRRILGTASSARATLSRSCPNHDPNKEADRLQKKFQLHVTTQEKFRQREVNDLLCQLNQGDLAKEEGIAQLARLAQRPEGLRIFNRNQTKISECLSAKRT